MKNIFTIILTICLINDSYTQNLYLGVFYKESMLDLVHKVEFLVSLPDSLYNSEKKIDWLIKNQRSSFLHLLNNEPGRIYFDIRASSIARNRLPEEKDSNSLLSCSDFLNNLENSKIDNIEIIFKSSPTYTRALKIYIYNLGNFETKTTVLPRGDCWFIDGYEGIKLFHQEKSISWRCNVRSIVACQ